MVKRLIANHYMTEAIDTLGNGMCTLAMVVSAQESLSEADSVRLTALWIDSGRKAIVSIERGLAMLVEANTLTVSDKPNSD